MSGNLKDPRSSALSMTEGCPIKVRILFPANDPNKQET